MTRSGPNQDVNDPATIIDLAYQYQQDSDDKGNLLAQSNAQNPNVSGTAIIDISIPFKKTDGSTELLQGSSIDYDEEYTYDSDLVADSTIVTYVDLAERFRDYWETLNNVLNQLNDYDYLQENDIDPTGPFTTVFPGSIIRTHGSLTGIAYEQDSYSHSPAASLSTPAWTGIGPTNYNQLTYPQLLSTLPPIEVQRNVSGIMWDTNYWYDKYSDTSGSVVGANARFGKDEDWLPPLAQEYVQFYNNGPTTMDISLSIDITATFDVLFTTSYYSFAEINDINVYPDPLNGNKALLPSFIAHSELKPNPGGTTVLSTTRTIEIPPGKSAFIGCGASASTTFGGLDTVNISLVLNGKTLIHGV